MGNEKLRGRVRDWPNKNPRPTKNTRFLQPFPNASCGVGRSSSKLVAMMQATQSRQRRNTPGHIRFSTPSGCPLWGRERKTVGAAKKTVSIEAINTADCSRNRSGQSTLEPSRTTAFNKLAATHSIENSYFHSISIDFNKSQNLVRDQGVGGSNPLSTTNRINNLENNSLDLETEQC